MDKKKFPILYVGTAIGLGAFLITSSWFQETPAVSIKKKIIKTTASKLVSSAPTVTRPPSMTSTNPTHDADFNMQPDPALLLKAKAFRKYEAYAMALANAIYEKHQAVLTPMEVNELSERVFSEPRKASYVHKHLGIAQEFDQLSVLLIKYDSLTDAKFSSYAKTQFLNILTEEVEDLLSRESYRITRKLTWLSYENELSHPSAEILIKDFFEIEKKMPFLSQLSLQAEVSKLRALFRFLEAVLKNNTKASQLKHQLIKSVEQQSREFILGKAKVFPKKIFKCIQGAEFSTSEEIGIEDIVMNILSSNDQPYILDKSLKNSLTKIRSYLHQVPHLKNEVFQHLVSLTYVELWSEIKTQARLVNVKLAAAIYQAGPKNLDEAIIEKLANQMTTSQPILAGFQLLGLSQEIKKTRKLVRIFQRSEKSQAKTIHRALMNLSEQLLREKSKRALCSSAKLQASNILTQIFSEKRESKLDEDKIKKKATLLMKQLVPLARKLLDNESPTLVEIRTGSGVMKVNAQELVVQYRHHKAIITKLGLNFDEKEHYMTTLVGYFNNRLINRIRVYR